VANLHSGAPSPAIIAVASSCIAGMACEWGSKVSCKAPGHRERDVDSLRRCRQTFALWRGSEGRHVS
jgi:hypothetical protein